MMKKDKKNIKAEKLTERQDSFCVEYVKDYNAKQAAIRAGYKEKTAESQASRLLRNVKVVKRINELKAKTTEKALKTVEDIMHELQTIAFSDPTLYFSELNDHTMTLQDFKKLPRELSAAIKKIKMSEGKAGIIVEFELYDKIKALEMLFRRFPESAQQYNHELKGEIVLKTSKMDDDYYKSMLDSHTNTSLNGEEDAETESN